MRTGAFFFALAALVAVSAAKRTAPYGDGWVYAMQYNDFNFDGKNDATNESYPREIGVINAKNPKWANREEVFCPICGKMVTKFPECDATDLGTLLYMNYRETPAFAQCQTMLTAAGTFGARAKNGVYNPHQIIGADLTDDMKTALANPCNCWGAITEVDAEENFYCTFDGVFLKQEWDQCEDQKELEDWDLKADGFNCEEAGVDHQYLTYSNENTAVNGSVYKRAKEWGAEIAGLFPVGGTAEDCADRCFDEEEFSLDGEKCGAFQFEVDRHYGDVDTHKRGQCTLFPKKMKLSKDGTMVDVKAPSNTKIGTARFCVKNGEPRTATSTCGSDIEEQLDLVGLLDKKPLTPPLTKNVARQLIQKLKVQFRALKEEYRAAKENLRNKGRAAGDGV